MNTVRSKLIRLGVSEKAAAALVAQGLDSPRKIKAAKYADLRKAGAEKDATVKSWRKK